MLPIYRMVDSVPVYRYPRPDEIREIIEWAMSSAGTRKRAQALIRKKYRCYLSVNIMFKNFVRNPIPYYAEPPVLSLKHLVVTGRARGRCNVIKRLEEMGLSVNPYSSFSRRRGKCFGFYCKSYDELFSIVERLGKCIDGVIINNAVWTMDVGRHINLRKLIDAGFAPSLRWGGVHGVVEWWKVTVFHTGKIRINGATTPEDARLVAGKLYGLLLKLGAIM